MHSQQCAALCSVQCSRRCSGSVCKRRCSVQCAECVTGGAVCSLQRVWQEVQFAFPLSGLTLPFLLLHCTLASLWWKVENRNFSFLEFREIMTILRRNFTLYFIEFYFYSFTLINPCSKNWRRRKMFMLFFLDTQVSLEPTHVIYNLAEPNITLLNRI